MAAPGYAICPYNSSHNILKERFQTHLVKCAKNYPDIELEKCPFNVTHLIPKAELDVSMIRLVICISILSILHFLYRFQYHVQECEDRASLDLYRYQIATPMVEEQKKRKVEPESTFRPLPESEENWDTDVSKFWCCRQLSFSSLFQIINY